MPFAEVAGLTMHYRAAGPAGAPRVVLLNSLGTDCRIWDDLISALGDRVRTLRYDERGQGLTDSPPGPYSIREHAEDLLGLLDHLGWARVVLCGLSIGGMIAMETCRRRPHAVRGMVLSDTADVIGPAEFWDGRMAEVREKGPASIAGPVVERWFGTWYREKRSVQARGWANLLARVPIEGYLGSCAALRDADLGAHLAELQVPAVCVCGSEDASTTPATVRSLASRLPDAEYVEIPGAGHLVPVERPAEFAGIVSQFLEERIGA